MIPRLWPRSIRMQMIVGIVLLESLSIALFAWFVTRQQVQEVYSRSERRLQAEARSLAMQAGAALNENRPDWAAFSVQRVGEMPDVGTARITNPGGGTLFLSSDAESPGALLPEELDQIREVPHDAPRCFTTRSEHIECVHAIFTGDRLRGFAWVENKRAWDNEGFAVVQRDTAIFGFIWIVASTLLVLAMLRSIAQPLVMLHRGTRKLIESPDEAGAFPLPVRAQNEIGEVIETFNQMVSSLAQQRAGLNDALSLLDSMLAHAPIGLAFVNRESRLVRVNQVFAKLSGAPLSRHLGRSLPEILPQAVGRGLEDAVLRVFAHGEPIADLEFSGQQDGAAERGRKWIWTASVYPVRVQSDQVRWAGIIATDISERKRSEEALRNSEKLTVTARLASSIAHEINNPLEAITNLLYLLHNFSPEIQGSAGRYLEMLEYEVRRISEITQQTLRFYRQSTLPGRVNIAEILEPVLSLYQARITSLGVQVERRFPRNLELFCFGGELRQVVANLVGNALDACAERGGRLLVCARRSRSWKAPGCDGVRFTVADTGEGMTPAVRQRLFEPFFTTKEATGTGLGLWVSQEIVHKHQGSITVRSRPENPGGPSRGTVFQFFIPDDSRLILPARTDSAAD